MDKKGAIELSVTAIIVLIIAIVILGIILGFVKTMFGSVASQFEDMIIDEPDPPSATASNPITVSRSAITVQAQKPAILKIDIHNPSNFDWTSMDGIAENAKGIVPNISCSTSGVIDQASVQVFPKTVRQGQSQSFNYIFNIGSVIAQPYLCQIVVKAVSADPSLPYNATYAKDVTIKVAS